MPESSAPRPDSGRTISLQRTVSLALSGMVLLTASAIIWGTYVRSRETILLNSMELIVQAARESQERVLAYLEVIAQRLRRKRRRAGREMEVAGDRGVGA